MVKEGGKREKLFERFSYERWMLLFRSPPPSFLGGRGVCFCSYFQRIVVFLPWKEEERSRGRAVEKRGGEGANGFWFTFFGFVSGTHLEFLERKIEEGM